ncbi:hypothetical protein BDQ17DRAFT_1372140 [Cyathus striatus]|nr:hypothetical protein BDQ17DRAFT_1372140 [Cyathus striatus]
MHPFGGTHYCPRCSKPVYAAEQVMGPGRKLYLKQCLTCKSCSKRLDSLSLVEHEEEPYCKNCHVKQFGTKDLRHSNLPYYERQQRSPSPPASPIRRTFSPPPLTSIRATNTGAANGRFPSPVRPLSTGNGATTFLRPTRTLTSPTMPSFPRRTPTPPEAVTNSHSIPEEEEMDSTDPVKPSSSAEQSQDEQPSQDTADKDSGPPTPVRSFSPVNRHRTSSSLGTISSPLTRSNSAAAVAARLLEEEGIAPPILPNGTGASTSVGTGTRPIIIPAATGSRYGAALGGTVPVNLTGMSTGITSSARKQWGGTTPVCPKCAKNVYFAEQVKAVGKVFHKGCLRCTECKMSLDSSRVRDHEGDPFCVRCYGKLHGPQGSGYALLGKAGA